MAASTSAVAKQNSCEPSSLDEIPATHDVADLKAEERRPAIAVARRVGAIARANDIKGAQGVFDAALIYPDGRVAALEITGHAGDDIRERDGLLDRDGHEWDAPGAWSWEIALESSAPVPSLDDLRRRYANIIMTLEQMGVKSTMTLCPTPWDDPPLPDDVWWALRHKIMFARLARLPAGQNRVYLGSQDGGTIDKSLDGLGKAIGHLFDDQVVQRHIAKLQRSGCPERHLFIGIFEGGLPFAQRYGLVDWEGGPPACQPPTLPPGLTHLWIQSSHWLIEITDGKWTFHALDDSDFATPVA